MLIVTAQNDTEARHAGPSFEPDPEPTAQAAEDRARVQRAAQGDAVAFEQLYRRHVGRIHAVVWRLLGGVEARAEEITQEVFIRAWRALSTFRGDSAFSTWLHRLAVNTALMDLRGRRGNEDRETDDEALMHLDDRSACRSLGLDLEAAVTRLPERARAVLVLHDVEGWKHEEIAVELGMAVGTSKAQLHRARSLLRGWLQGGEA